jgi:hypothetical protein
LEEALHDESSVHTVKPGTFISIVEDLNHYSLEEVKSRYGLDDEFVKILNAAKLSIPTEKVVPQKEVCIAFFLCSRFIQTLHTNDLATATKGHL